MTSARNSIVLDQGVHIGLTHVTGSAREHEWLTQVGLFREVKLLTRDSRGHALSLRLLVAQSIWKSQQGDKIEHKQQCTNTDQHVQWSLLRGAIKSKPRKVMISVRVIKIGREHV